MPLLKLIIKNNKSLNISELSLEGYNLYCNDLTQNTRGVIIYVDNALKSSEINFEVSFNETLFVRINSDIVIGNIYRSPSSTEENDTKLYELVDTLSKECNNFILTGDFNFSDINWSYWTSATNSSSSLKFINKMQANLLMQHVDTPTRARGMDTPHILDLVITNNDIIDSIDYLAPLGKSDHSVFRLDALALSVIATATWLGG